MTQVNKLTGVFLAVCLLLSLCACDQDPAPTTVPGTTVPTVTTSPSTEPSASPSTAPTETTAPPTEPAPDAESLYSAAREGIYGLNDLVLEYDYTENRLVGSETFTENRAGTASYTGLRSDTPEALIAETFACGGYSTQYYESYLNGAGWCRVNNSNFRCDMSASAFIARQIPAVLTERSLYATVTAERTADGYILYFKDAYAPESWIADTESITLTAAEGKLYLDASGNLTGGSYHAEYLKSSTYYALDVSVSVSRTENVDLSGQQPVYPENSPVISSLEIPKYLLRTVGHVYGAENMSVRYTDTLSGEYFGQTRTQTNSYNTYGSGDAFMATRAIQTSVAGLSGSATTNTRIQAFWKGQYSDRFNSGDAVIDSTVTAQQFRISLEDSILSALMMPGYIAGAQTVDNGSTLTVYFTGNSALADSLCVSIYSLFDNIDLDALAASYSTEYIQGYLTVDKSSGLPVAMGMSLSRSHKINNMTYQLTYQLDQTLSFSAADAYESITGEKLAAE